MIQKTENKVKSLGAEMYPEGVWLSFTINPEYQEFKKNSIHRVRLVTEHVNNILLKSIKNYCEYEIYPEISKRGRIHYHGKIRINDVFNFLLVGVYRLGEKSIYEIDIINDKDKWNAYIKKDEKVMKNNYKKLNVPYKLTSITSYNDPKTDPTKGRPITDYL